VPSDPVDPDVQVVPDVPADRDALRAHSGVEHWTARSNAWVRSAGSVHSDAAARSRAPAHSALPARLDVPVHLPARVHFREQHWRAGQGVLLHLCRLVLPEHWDAWVRF
jgi:hypothetical protein